MDMTFGIGRLQNFKVIRYTAFLIPPEPQVVVLLLTL
jgi:hypothetical protein